MTPALAVEQAATAKAVSPRLARLKVLAERAAKLNEGVLKERIAVRDPYGGWAIKVQVTPL